jgi:hypothetical protein
MNIDRIPEKLTRWIVIVCGMALAFFTVRSAAYSQWGNVGLIFLGLLVAAAVLAFRERIWIAIPLFWSLHGQIPEVPLPFTIRDYAVTFVFGGFLVLKALKIIRRQSTFRWLDGLMFLMLAYVTAVFVRNPVGVDALNSERVGGRPYFTLLIAFLAYWVLCRSTLGNTDSRKLTRAVTVSRVFDGVLAQIAAWSPAIGGLISIYYFSPYFAMTMNPFSLPDDPGAESTSRLEHLMAVGQAILFYLFATGRPLALLDFRRPVRLILLITGLACVLLSGFRSAMILSFGVALLSSYVQAGPRELMRVGALTLGGLFLMILGQGTLFDLPRSAQRALSFLPGNWDEFAIADSRSSTEWRLEIWKEVLSSDRYIESRLWGDGFGFRKRDLERMKARRESGRGGEQEDFMISGAVHSGPISAIRVVGYVGLVIYLCLMVSVAIEAWRLARLSRGTPMQAFVFLFCLPMVAEPFYYIFVFGAFDGSLPEMIYWIGILHLLRNSLEDYLRTKRAELPANSVEFARDQQLDHAGQSSSRMIA